MSLASRFPILGRRLLALPLLGPLALAGCSSGPNYTPATGTVTLHGKPLAGASVTFTPDPPQPGVPAATATTDASGAFAVQTNLPGGQTKPGLRPASYKVTVSKFVPPKGMTEEQYQKLVDASQDPKRPYSPDAVPTKVESAPKEYTEVANTKLKATVEAGKAGEFKFEIP